jgi:hypothetical protein
VKPRENLRIAAATARVKMPVPRSSDEDGSGTALGVGVRTKAVDGEWSDVDGIVGIEDIDVIGAVVVDVGRLVYRTGCA